MKYLKMSNGAVTRLVKENDYASQEEMIKLGFLFTYDDSGNKVTMSTSEINMVNSKVRRSYMDILYQKYDEDRLNALNNSMRLRK